MLRSSDCFAALAGALAKAQAELITSEKSETATIPPGSAGQSERTLSHEPLKSGLDAVRKALSNYELAAIQTTSIDRAGGMVNLTTTLIHSSGEWIASEWPVGPAAAAAHPQRMGTALTYARRCALFTLIGIACEDHLDAQAPDAPGLVPPAAESPAPKPTSDLGAASLLECSTAAATNDCCIPLPPLPPQDSARLREGMLAEIQALEASGAAAWGQSMLAARNRLTLECAHLVEAAFVARFPEFANLEAKASVEPKSPAEQPQQISVDGHPSGDLGGGAQEVIAVIKTVRHRNKEHLRFVGAQPCLICARQPSDAHHLRFAQPRALGRKVSDEFAVPLCRVHHREVHRSGSELQWWSDRKLTPLAIAAELWRRTQFAHRDD